MKRLMSILVIAAMLVAAVNVHISASAVKVKKPSKVSIKSIQTVSTNAIRLSWKKVKKAKGYQIKLAANKNLTKGKKTININKNKKAKTIKDLKSGTKYYVKVRAYTKRSGKKIYGKWSKIKSAYTKQKKVKKIKKKNKGPHALPETVEDYEPGYIPDSNYVEQEPTTQPTTQSRTLTAEEIYANKQKLSTLNEQLRAKYDKGNYYKLNNGENGRQIYDSSRWNDIVEQIEENTAIINGEIDVSEWYKEAWDYRFWFNDCLINDIPLNSIDTSVYHDGIRIDLNKYPMLQEFFRSNPANITNDMSDIEKLEAIARYVAANGIYISGEDRYGENNQDTYYGLVDYPDEADSELISEAYRILLLDGKGVCKDFSNTCSIWAGYYDIYCVGIVSSDINHQWNRAILKDKNGIEGWYEIDASAGNYKPTVKKVSFDLSNNMKNVTDAIIGYTNWIYINK